MFVDRQRKSVNFKVYVASLDDGAQNYVSAFASAMGMPAGLLPSGGNQIRMVQIAVSGIPGWKAEVHLFAVTYPSMPASRLLTMKASDGVVLVFGARAEDDAALLTEVRTHIENLGYGWEAFPKVGFVPNDREAIPIEGLDTVSGDLATGAGVQEPLRRLSKRFIASANEELVKRQQS